MAACKGERLSKQDSEKLLRAWGNEVQCAGLEVSIRSPLGALGQETGGAGNGRRDLSVVECWAVMSKPSQAVQAALELMAQDEPVGHGSLGRVLKNLASVRYCRAPALTVAEQCQLLAISERTYRDRVDDLRGALSGALPAVARARQREDDKTPAAVCARERLEQARAISRREARADKKSRAAIRQSERTRALVALAGEQ